MLYKDSSFTTVAYYCHCHSLVSFVLFYKVNSVWIIILWSNHFVFVPRYTYGKPVLGLVKVEVCRKSFRYYWFSEPEARTDICHKYSMTVSTAPPRCMCDHKQFPSHFFLKILSYHKGLSTPRIAVTVTIMIMMWASTLINDNILNIDSVSSSTILMVKPCTFEWIFIGCHCFYHSCSWKKKHYSYNSWRGQALIRVWKDSVPLLLPDNPHVTNMFHDVHSKQGPHCVSCTHMARHRLTYIYVWV